MKEDQGCWFLLNLVQPKIHDNNTDLKPFSCYLPVLILTVTNLRVKYNTNSLCCSQPESGQKPGGFARYDLMSTYRSC